MVSSYRHALEKGKLNLINRKQGKNNFCTSFTKEEVMPILAPQKLFIFYFDLCIFTVKGVQIFYILYHSNTLPAKNTSRKNFVIYLLK